MERRDGAQRAAQASGYESRDETIASTRPIPAFGCRLGRGLGGCSLLPGFGQGHLWLLIAKPGEEARPLIQTSEQTSPPVTLLGNNEMAFLLGKHGAQTIAVASLSDGRILRHIGGAKQQGIQS